MLGFSGLRLTKTELAPHCDEVLAFPHPVEIPAEKQSLSPANFVGSQKKSWPFCDGLLVLCCVVVMTQEMR